MKFRLFAAVGGVVLCAAAGYVAWNGRAERPSANAPAPAAAERSEDGARAARRPEAAPGEPSAEELAVALFALGLAGGVGSPESESVDEAAAWVEESRPGEAPLPEAAPLTVTFDLPEHISEPQARRALALVGANPMADAIWIQAINDAELSDGARSNLIEDLNEDGFPDYHNITPGDLPLIENRLDLIARLLPDAMDRVNEDALKEARKDLRNMRDRIKF